MGAIVWAGIGGVAFSTSIAVLSRVGFHHIDISAASVAGAASFCRGSLLGGVLASETYRLFADRKGG